MYDLSLSKEDEFKLSQYISAVDESLLLRSHVITNSRLIYWNRLFYLVSFHQLLNNTVDVSEDVSVYRRSRRVLNSSITCNHNLRLVIWIDFSTSSIFSFLTDFDMSLVFFVDQLWLLGRMLSRRWKLCTTAFTITQRSNIVQTALNWDLLTLLTSIRT